MVLSLVFFSLTYTFSPSGRVRAAHPSTEQHVPAFRLVVSLECGDRSAFLTNLFFLPFPPPPQTFPSQVWHDTLSFWWGIRHMHAPSHPRL